MLSTLSVLYHLVASNIYYCLHFTDKETEAILVKSQNKLGRAATCICVGLARYKGGPAEEARKNRNQGSSTWPATLALIPAEVLMGSLRPRVGTQVLFRYHAPNSKKGSVGSRFV